MLTVHKCSDTELLWHLGNSAFSSQYLQQEITSEAQLFFENIPNFMYIREMQKEINKIFFDFEIIECELVALNTRFY